jgi:hypothetical protein
MTIHSVPADLDPDSMLELVDDCREVSGMLAPYVIDLTHIPAPRAPLPFAIPAQGAAVLEGYGEYGS